MTEQKGHCNNPWESTPEMSAYQFIIFAGDKLKLPQPTVATAIVLFYRVQNSQSQLLLHRKEQQEQEKEKEKEGCDVLDDYLLVTTCINLACKTTEVSRKVRDIINVGYRILHPEEPPLRIGEAYWQMKDSLLSSELIVLRMLRFEMDVELPYPWINKILKGMCYWKDVEIENDVDRLLQNDPHPTIQAIFRLAWAFAHDCLRSQTIMISNVPIHIALACVHLAIRSLNVTNPQPFHEWCKMWGVMNPETIKSLIIQIISM